MTTRVGRREDNDDNTNATSRIRAAESHFKHATREIFKQLSKKQKTKEKLRRIPLPEFRLPLAKSELRTSGFAVLSPQIIC